MDERRAQAAWLRIEELGGFGVWEREFIVVSFAESRIRDDLAVFADFPFVQILDLSGNHLTDACLKYLEHLTDLETLTVVNTGISRDAIEEFANRHPRVDIQTEPPPPETINSVYW